MKSPIDDGWDERDMNFAENKEELEDSEPVKEEKCAKFKQNVLHQEKYEKCKMTKGKYEKAFMDDDVIDLVSDDDPLGKKALLKKEKAPKECKYDKYEKCKGYKHDNSSEEEDYDRLDDHRMHRRGDDGERAGFELAPKECKYDKYEKDKSYKYEKDKS